MLHSKYDVIIIGGSFAGLSAAMALGRSLRNVLIIDAGMPCNIQTPASHNMVTLDGQQPAEILAKARKEVLFYNTVKLLNETAENVARKDNGFSAGTSSGKMVSARKLIVATGVKDMMPEIEGFADCWGISILHCPYCHGYEVRGRKTGILLNGDPAFEFAKMISHWTSNLTVFTNGASVLSADQVKGLRTHNISIVEGQVKTVAHSDGYLEGLNLADGTQHKLEALYTKLPFQQPGDFVHELDCNINEQGYIQVDEVQRTSVHGVYAAGDCTTRFRAVSTSIASGTVAGAAVNKELIDEDF